MSMTLSSSSAAALVGVNNDLICQILSRLPLDSVVRLRLVCKEWRSLASTQFFIDMHHNINQTPPYFVVQYFDDEYYLSIDPLKSDHFNTLLFTDESEYDKDNNNININIFMKSVRESINLSSNFRLLGGGEEEEGKIYYQQQVTNTNLLSEKTYYHIELISSCGGFLLYTAKPAAADMSMLARFRRWLTKDEEEDPGLILYNPVTKEKHTVTAPSSTHVYCGFYYHSPTKEHRILYQLMFHHEEDGFVRFLVFGLQTKSTRVLKLKVNNYITPDYNTRDTAYYNHIDTSTPPVISNGYLHWFVSEDNRRRAENSSCSRSILSFGMESEEFRTMPHPPLLHTCDPWYDSKRKRFIRHEMNLLEMEGGVLCLCDGTRFRSPILEIYVMEDYKKWTWIRRYRIDLREYIHISCDEYGLYYKALQILQGDELLLHYHPNKRDWSYQEYALYSLNHEHEGEGQAPGPGPGPLLLNNNTGMVRQPFEVIFRGYPGRGNVFEGLRRMLIMPDDQTKRPPSVGSNMVLLTPSLASLQHSGSAPGVGTFFSIRTNRSYEYI